MQKKSFNEPLIDVIFVNFYFKRNSCCVNIQLPDILPGRSS
jgi:hypothetical protein